MIKHSMIIEDFFNDADSVRKMIITEPMIDHKAEDGVTYPGIVDLPQIIKNTNLTC